jgi:hypothetical protein
LIRNNMKPPKDKKKKEKDIGFSGEMGRLVKKK